MADTNSRIKAIQSRLSLSQTGIFDIATAQSVLKEMGKSNTSSNLTTLVKKVQEGLNIIPPTGFFGPVSLTRLEAFLEPKPVAMVPGATMIVSKKGLDMIIGYEVSSKENYNKRLQSPILPAGASGITIGIGYDLGHNTAAQITGDWSGQVLTDVLALLVSAAGLKGATAQPKMAELKGIKIPYENALQVFYHTTVPRFAASTRKAFPGVEKLPPDAQSAILSLVFNRGASTKAGDNSRIEMANMIPLVKAGNLDGIAGEFRKMKRLWIGKPGLAGVVTRREKEAIMVEKASFNLLPEDQVLV